MQVETACVNGYVVIILEHYIFLILTDRSPKRGGLSGFAGICLKHQVDFLEQCT